MEGIQYDVTKLNMPDKKSRNFLLDTINKSFHFSQVSVMKNPSLVMFYYTAFLTHNVYYIKELDVIAIADFKAHVLHLKGVFCENEVLLDEVISTLSNKKISKVVLEFTPKDKYPYNENILVSEDVLFILDDKWDLFDDGKLQLPVLSHA